MPTKKSSSSRRPVAKKKPSAAKSAGKKTALRKLKTPSSKRGAVRRGQPVIKSKPKAKAKSKPAAVPNALEKLVAEARILGEKIAKAV